MIVPIWKKIGESTHLLAQKTGQEIAKKTGDKSHLKATHTGTLDPMAEGVVVVLTAEDRYFKGTFSDWKKTYTFQVLFGTSTDTHDLLGLQTNSVQKPIHLSQIMRTINATLPKFLGKQTQAQPNFSAQRIAGKSAFDLAKKGEILPTIKNNIEIFSLEICSSTDIDLQILQTEINSKIKSITGDFRQEQILFEWQKLFKQLQINNITQLPLITFQATVSKRTYIRQLVADLQKHIQLPATTFSITRIQNGTYTKKDTK